MSELFEELYKAIEQQDDSTVKSLLENNAEAVQNLFSEIDNCGKIEKLRYYEVIANTISKSNEALTYSKKYIEKMIKEFFEEQDLLEKLNLVAILEKMMKTQIGFSFLENDFQFFTKLIQHITPDLKNEEAVLEQPAMLINQILTTLSEICSNEEIENTIDVFCKSNNFGETLEFYFEFSETKETSILAVGSLAKSKKGLQYLISNEELLNKYTENFGKNDTATSFFLTSLSSFLTSETIFKNCVDETNQIINNLSKKNGPLISNLMNLLKKPFPELRISVFRAFQGISLYPWGMNILAQNPEFADFILDRSTEDTTEGFEWKYAIITVLATKDTSICSQEFGDQNLVKFKTYQKEGPFAPNKIDPIVKVATMKR